MDLLGLPLLGGDGDGTVVAPHRSQRLLLVAPARCSDKTADCFARCPHTFIAPRDHSLRRLAGAELRDHAPLVRAVDAPAWRIPLLYSVPRVPRHLDPAGLSQTGERRCAPASAGRSFSTALVLRCFRSLADSQVAA